MPMLLNKAVSFALFKTYAIPTISKLLLATKELGSAKNVARRYADTEILIATWAGCPINGFNDPTAQAGPDKPAEDPRASIALARVNFLHSKYKISNDDYLYTLALFVLEPIQWTNLYGWRRLSPMEQDAFFIFWRDIGGRMGITDIPETLQDMKAWSNAYEEKCMVPAESNRLVAGFTIGELIYAIPKKLGLKSFAERFVAAVVEPRVRIAMMLPEQPRPIHWIAESLLTVNWIIQRWFRLPRSDSNFWFSVDPRLPKPDRNGEVRMRPTSEYRSTPWYKPEPTGIFYVLNKLAVMLGFYAEMPGPRLVQVVP
ncbi:hypothetical protein EST38_g3771 [Candolleomyces aberdarensis]|uniref:ER-bound oxygenase mpaB/mpaB'/Rubber oxygenase catalytic domain-containing protein n=1 Tax=Candolleomyces aberdarensis TaxID=2316362 RepID=A0A4Q2DPX3_9AGAR|nr:hypothetical protein EST38_g3771 [Candolleomyces aberdarensis]